MDDDPGLLNLAHQALRTAQFAVQTFTSGQALLERSDWSRPGCVVLDFGLPGRDGLGVQRELIARGCHLPVIIMTGQGTVPMSVLAMKQGAFDVLTKPFRPGQLVAAVRSALEQDAPRREAARRVAALTRRERAMVDQVAGGHLNKQIASNLGVKECTVKLHRRNLMRKLSAESLPALLRLAIRSGLVAVDSLGGTAQKSPPIHSRAS
ncbi:MAG: response regulator transcription factor [Verrucomicrobia bacterium]|nr:response regulator transcription factor [Verrucomicrobiota bacterium]